MSKKYKKSPIVEAVCEFQFEESSPWDLAIPGLVYEKVRNTFPIRRQAERVTLNITVGPQALGPQLGTVTLMQYLRQDEKAMLQVGSHLLSMSVLKPYPSWPRFLPMIQNGFNAYRDVAAPKGLKRIGLRYINQIEVPDQGMKLEDYFEFRPYVGSNLPQDFGTFALGIQVPCEDSRDILNLQLASVPRQDLSMSKAIIVLSLDYFLLKPGDITLEEVFKWVELAHSHIEDTFEACITEKLRHVFQEVKR